MARPRGLPCERCALHGHRRRALLSFGDYARYLTEDVRLTIEGTDRAVSGREAVRQLITFMHTQAFETDIQVKGVVCGI